MGSHNSINRLVKIWASQINDACCRCQHECPMPHSLTKFTRSITNQPSNGHEKNEYSRSKKPFEQRVLYCPQIRKCFIRLSSAWPPRRKLSRLHCTGRIIPWEFSQIGAMINFKAWKFSEDALYFLCLPTSSIPLLVWRFGHRGLPHPHLEVLKVLIQTVAAVGHLYPCYPSKDRGKNFLSTHVLQSGENGKTFER